METTGRIRPPGMASHSRGLPTARPSTAEPIVLFSLVPRRANNVALVAVEDVERIDATRLADW